MTFTGNSLSMTLRGPKEASTWFSITSKTAAPLGLKLGAAFLRLRKERLVLKFRVEAAAASRRRNKYGCLKMDISSTTPVGFVLQQITKMQSKQAP
jgi:hypothetical protein